MYPTKEEAAYPVLLYVKMASIFLLIRIYIPGQAAPGNCCDSVFERRRSLRRCRLVIVQKAKLQLRSEVTAALASHSRDHRLPASGFFPCLIDREYLYGYAADGYCSPL